MLWDSTGGILQQVPCNAEIGKDHTLVVNSLGAYFREYPGVQIQRTRFSGSASDFAGEYIVRLVSCYLRWTI